MLFRKEKIYHPKINKKTKKIVEGYTESIYSLDNLNLQQGQWLILARTTYRVGEICKKLKELRAKQDATLNTIFSLYKNEPTDECEAIAIMEKNSDSFNFLKDEENIYIYDSKKSYEAATYTNQLRKKNNIKVKELNKQDIHDLEPNLAHVYFAGHLFVGSRHTTNPLAISQKIFESFLNGGGEFINQNVNYLTDKEDLIEISLDESKIRFDQVVICAGAWSKSLAKMIGDNLPLDTERGYHVLFDIDKQLINRPIGWSQSGFYLVQMDDGIRASGTVEIAGLEKPMNQKRINMIEIQARKILPQLGKIKSTWMGRRPTLPDAKPVIGRSPKNKKVMYAFGHQHIGWTLAAVTGKAINELAKGFQPNFDITAFSPNRFN